MFNNLAAGVDVLFDPILFIINPQKRIYWLYLLSSAALVGLVFVWQGRNGWLAVKKLVSPALWISQSSLVDVQWLFLNHLLRVILVVPLIGGQLAFALGVNKYLVAMVGEGNFVAWSPLLISVLFTLSIFITQDFSRFLVHYAYHKIPCLWRFHAVHHSATSLTPLTLYRVHSVEMVINSGRSVVVVGSVSGVFMYVFSGAITVIDVMGVSIFTLLFNLAGANLRHSSIYIGFGRLETLLISPAQHQIHHSSAKQHIDKNFGSCFALWDRLFGSWLASNHEQVSQYGLAGEPAEQMLSKQWLGIS